MGEIIADVELENAVDHELAKAGHLEDREVRRATVRIGVECTAPSRRERRPGHRPYRS